MTSTTIIYDDDIVYTNGTARPAISRADLEARLATLQLRRSQATAWLEEQLPKLPCALCQAEGLHPKILQECLGEARNKAFWGKDAEEIFEALKAVRYEFRCGTCYAPPANEGVWFNSSTKGADFMAKWEAFHSKKDGSGA